MPFSKLFKSNFFIRLKSWEYWPFWVVQLPLVFYWLFLSLKARSFVFFAGSNPGITLGGMLGESKYAIMKNISPQLKPKTLLITSPASLVGLLKTIQQHELSFPLVFKPDIGERGFMVKRIYSEAQAEEYIRNTKVNFLVQELVDLPVECGVFYARHPNEPLGKVTSIVLKEMLAVKGDGVSTLRKLILENDRAKLQWMRLKEVYAEELQTVLPQEKVVELNSIGNHCLGTKFIDGCHLITDEISLSFDLISKQLDGFFFGRFDLKCASIDDLINGNVKILEVNGCGAEPAHIYNPGYPLTRAYGVLFRHWNTMYAISEANRKSGFDYPSFGEALKIYKHFQTAMSNRLE